MTEGRTWGGLRAELATAIALVTAIAVGASFLALYSGTGSRLRGQIDSQLRIQAAEWHLSTASKDLSTPAALERAAHAFVAGQRYHAEALLIAIQVGGGATVTNDSEASGLTATPLGLTTANVGEAGRMRVLSQPIVSQGRRAGTLRVADPLKPVDQAQADLRHTFLVVGLLALVLAVAVGIGLATVIAAPLRKMARVAVAAEAGDLSVRTGPVRARGEVRVLSDAFDHMLSRLERAFRRQRDFVSDASHELRTPLTVVRAQVELLDRETDERARHEGTGTLLRRLDELDRLVSDMLTLASVEAGQLVEPAPIALGDFFEDLRRDLPLFGDRDYEVEPIDGVLNADDDRLTQVLRNLVRNAVAQTAVGDPIAIVARPVGDASLEIAVSDGGPGIPADQLERIFERFHRGDDDRSRERGGSGLGLAIARAIVEAHGGTIRAESPPGAGATFRIELPGYRAPASAPAVPPRL